MCSFLSPTLATLFHPEDRVVARRTSFEIKMPSFVYQAEGPKKYQRLSEKLNVEHWETGIFLMLPITHFEGKDWLSEKDKLSVNKAGYSHEILDY
jgi:hypothetical protein